MNTQHHLQQDNVIQESKIELSKPPNKRIKGKSTPKPETEGLFVI